MSSRGEGSEVIKDFEKLSASLSSSIDRLIRNGFDNDNINYYFRGLRIISNFYRKCPEVKCSLEYISKLLMDKFRPRILVFSTNTISDVAIDLAGLMHQHYCPTTYIIRVPCSSMIRPDIILYAFYCGFDGVFIAADGTDCPYLDDCIEKTARNVQQAYELLKKEGIEPERLKMSGICSVCTDAFVNSVNEFYERLKKLGPIGIKIPLRMKVV